MLEPRLYRRGLILVGLAVAVVAFSLIPAPGPLTASLVPDAYDGAGAYATMESLAAAYPSRRPGSAGDDAVAAVVARAFAADGLVVSTAKTRAATAVGSRTIETVTGTLTGDVSGSIVVVAHRDALGSPATADLSGTATLLELASVLSGQTRHRSVVLVSTSGSAGAAGSLAVARALSASVGPFSPAGALAGPVDGVIVLGDLAGGDVDGSVVVPWSDSSRRAPPVLVETVSRAVSAQTASRARSLGLAGQFARLALALTTGEQGPFAAHGDPAVLLSSSGERTPGASEPVAGAGQIAALGRAVLSAVDALDQGPELAGPSGYLVTGSGMVLPSWAVRLLVLALIAPVLITAVDGLARARRRGHALGRWMLWALAGAAPFALAVVIARGMAIVGVIAAAPPGPVAPGVVALGRRGEAIMAGLALVILVSLMVGRPALVGLLRRRCPSLEVGGDRPPAGLGRAYREPEGRHRGRSEGHRAGGRRGRSEGDRAGGRRVRSEGDRAGGRRVRSEGDAAGVAVLALLCAVAVAIWAANPFAAALLVPALHLWLWIAEPGVVPRGATLTALVVAGMAAPVLVVVYCALTCGYSAMSLAWAGTLVVAGGQIGIVTALMWSVVAGCLVSVSAIAVARANEWRAQRPPGAVALAWRPAHVAR